MVLDRTDLDVKMVSDLLVGPAQLDECQHLPLTWREVHRVDTDAGRSRRAQGELPAASGHGTGAGGPARSDVGGDRVQLVEPVIFREYACDSALGPSDDLGRVAANAKHHQTSVGVVAMDQFRQCGRVGITGITMISPVIRSTGSNRGAVRIDPTQGLVLRTLASASPVSRQRSMTRTLGSDDGTGAAESIGLLTPSDSCRDSLPLQPNGEVRENRQE